MMTAGGGKKSNEISHHGMAITVEFFFTLVVYNYYNIYTVVASVQYYIALGIQIAPVYVPLGTNIFGPEDLEQIEIFYFLSIYRTIKFAKREINVKNKH